MEHKWQVCVWMAVTIENSLELIVVIVLPMDIIHRTLQTRSETFRGCFFFSFRKNIVISTYV